MWDKIFGVFFTVFILTIFIIPRLDVGSLIFQASRWSFLLMALYNFRCGLGVCSVVNGRKQVFRNHSPHPKGKGAKSCFHWALCHCPASGLCRHDSIFWLRPVHHRLSLRADSDIANYFCSCFPHIL